MADPTLLVDRPSPRWDPRRRRARRQRRRRGHALPRRGTWPSGCSPRSRWDGAPRRRGPRLPGL